MFLQYSFLKLKELLKDYKDLPVTLTEQFDDFEKNCRIQDGLLEKNGKKNFDE